MQLATHLQLETRQATVRRADPRLIARNAILELSISQLQQRIEEELCQNPALEVAEDLACPVCGQPLSGSLCRNCGYAQPDSPEGDLADLEPELHFAGRPAADERASDIVSFLESEFTLPEYLAQQARAAAPRHLFPVIEYLINNLNADGYLECSLVEAATRLGVDLKAVERGLMVLQSLDPPGIGARTLQECLLLQLGALREEGEDDPWAERILRECWRLLSARAYSRIAHQLDITAGEAQRSIDFIRRRLYPCPGRCFRPPWHWQGHNPKAVARPDLIVTASPNSSIGYRVEVVTTLDAALRLNDHYAALSSTYSGRPGRSPEGQHVVEAVERARRFISYLEERQQTIRRITEQVIVRQRDFFDTGTQAYLRPLTRAEVAEATGLDESTVSRATAGKFVLLPTRQLVPYAMFFDASLALKSVIARLVAAEGKEKPLSDRRLAELLGALGFSIARRTVAKYREAAGIPMAELRAR